MTIAHFAFQNSVPRISALVDDVKHCIETYRYVVSWKNPLVTGISLYVFIRLCVWFDPAYMGSFPVFLIILGMLYLASKRAYGTMKQRFIQREIEKNRKVIQCHTALVSCDHSFSSGTHRFSTRFRLKMARSIMTYIDLWVVSD